MSQREGIATFLWAVAPIVLGFLFSLTTSGAIRHPIAAPIFSNGMPSAVFALFLAAKIPEYRKGIYVRGNERNDNKRTEMAIPWVRASWCSVESWMGAPWGRVVSGH
ncbi:MAG: hypothetical protein IPL01_13650 [Acidobacteria bacterium]|nr:hypothetical protein [Acidobacteriota bacterium]